MLVFEFVQQLLNALLIFRALFFFVLLSDGCCAPINDIIVSAVKFEAPMQSVCNINTVCQLTLLCSIARFDIPHKCFYSPLAVVFTIASPEQGYSVI